KQKLLDYHDQYQYIQRKRGWQLMRCKSVSDTRIYDKNGRADQSQAHHGSSDRLRLAVSIWKALIGSFGGNLDPEKNDHRCKHIGQGLDSVSDKGIRISPISRATFDDREEQIADYTDQCGSKTFL